jgi:fumarate reductase (CoM/CoB) subunit A
MIFYNFNEVISTDILVIGAGGAGLRAAIEASDNNVNVLAACKGRFSKTGSTFFPLVPGWGIQFLKEEKGKSTGSYFVEEILKVGEGMAYPELAKILVDQTPDRVNDLERIGIKFHKINGKFYDFLCCFSNVKRTVAAALDINNIQVTFRKEIERRKIEVIEDFNVIKIIFKEEGNGRRVCGAVGIDRNGGLVLIRSKAIVLASGGGSVIFKQNMNSPELTGDGYELALDSGASLINMEYIQYIYGIIAPIRIHFSEKVFMYNPPVLNLSGSTFIERYLPQNLSINDVISERIKHGPFTSRLISKYYDIAIYSEIREGRGTKNHGIFLDLSQLKEHIDDLEKEFPATKEWIEWLSGKGIDIQKDMLEITLCAHANNGGIYVNSDTMSEVYGLFACGEIMGGPHGADRQGGNMMAATQVFGKIAGKNAANYSKDCLEAKIDQKDLLLTINEEIKLIGDGIQDYKNIKTKIQNAVSEELVICRRDKGLKKLIEELSDLSEMIASLKISKTTDIKNYFNLRSMIRTALIIANSALMRKESRGSHHREDYTQKNDKEFRKIIKINRKNGKNIYKFIKSPS